MQARALLGLGVMLLGCRTPCAAEEKATLGQLLKEQKAMHRGQAICRELVTPQLEVRDRVITVTGSKPSVLGVASVLPRDTIVHYEPLATKLGGYREHFKMVRAEAYEPTLHATFAADVEATVAASLLTTAAEINFTRMRLVVEGTAPVAVEWAFRARPTVCIQQREGRAHASGASYATAAAATDKVCPGACEVVAFEVDAASRLPPITRAIAEIDAQPKHAEKPPRFALVSFGTCASLGL